MIRYDSGNNVIWIKIIVFKMDYCDIMWIDFFEIVEDYWKWV